MNLAWVYIIIASIFEITWAIGLKYSHGLTKFWPSAGTILAMLLSFWFLSLGTKSLPVGTAYAVWTGTGAVGTALLGMLLFNESISVARLFFIGLIAIGIIGLKISSGN